MINAKHRFKEGWVMLLRPFNFANLYEPLQKLTVLYVYSEKPLISMELTDEGIKEINKLHSTPLAINFFESQHDLENKFLEKEDSIIAIHSTIEIYEGEVVQATVNGELCRFYPDEYKIINKETFEHVLIADEYIMEIENKTMFNIREVASRIHYIQSRGINKTLAERMSATDAKDSVIFRPRIELLEYFCRENEII